MGKFRVALQNHEFLVVQNQIRPLVELRQHRQGIVQFLGQTPCLGIAVRRFFAKFNQTQHLDGQRIAHAGDRPGGSTSDVTVEHLRIHPHHQCQARIPVGDIFSGISQGGCTTEFLEADQVRELTIQVKKQFGLGFETVIGTVVNDRRQLPCRAENIGKVGTLRCRRNTTGKHARYHHQPGRTDLTGMRRVVDRLPWALCPGTDHHRHTGLGQAAHTLLSLLIGQQWPVAHRTAIHHPTHPGLNQALGRCHQCIKIGCAGRIAGRHQGGNASTKYIRTHPRVIIRTQHRFGQMILT